MYLCSLYLPCLPVCPSISLCNSVVGMAQLALVFFKIKELAVRLGGGIRVFVIICAFHTPHSSLGVE